DCTITFLLGGPGSGKGTQAALLVEEFGLVHLSVGDLLRDAVARQTEHGVMIDQMMKEGKIVPTEISLDLLQEAMKAIRSHRRARGFLLDGFPRTAAQAARLDVEIGQCKRVLVFDVPDDIIVQRLLKRGETSGRADDNLESIKKRLVTFREVSLPVIQHYQQQGRVEVINADQDIQTVF
ncbi:hypothetical protein CXG81DRAFT_8195, partial [Caulochytrium protostelioides]